jgi:hypothetical protein
MIELHPQAVSLLKQKYDILLQVNARSFDNNWSVLSHQLDCIKKEKFSANERILIVHMDTDYYDELLPYGLIVVNLIRMFQNKDIPLYLLLFVTNHIGIKQEFDSLLKTQHKNDRPTVIETLLSPLLLSNNFALTGQCNIDQVIKGGILMMGKQRSHRVAMCNFIVDSQLLDHVAMSTNF